MLCVATLCSIGPVGSLVCCECECVRTTPLREYTVATIECTAVFLLSLERRMARL